MENQGSYNKTTDLEALIMHRFHCLQDLSILFNCDGNKGYLSLYLWTSTAYKSISLHFSDVIKHFSLKDSPELNIACTLCHLKLFKL